MDDEPPHNANTQTDAEPEPTPSPSAEEWTYPTRTCRICLEEVPATVTMYPPGLPIQLQTPTVEYKNSDEYGRLIRPCLCKGGMRYIHELCLMQSRVNAGGRASAKWQCPTCLHKFSFQRLDLQRVLESRAANAGITVVVLVVLMFVLGFVADPLINLYFDPYGTIAYNDYWQHIDLNEVMEDDELVVGWWKAHFTKGFVTMGLVGFLKTLLANPWNWWNWRPGGMMGGRVRTGNTGQERVVNVSWVAVVVGVCTAFYFFYQWIQSIVGRTLHRIGNNIVDTHLPGDDDDIKPPPGFKHKHTHEQGTTETPDRSDSDDEWIDIEPKDEDPPTFKSLGGDHSTAATAEPDQILAGQSSAIDTARSQGWSFRGI